MSLYVDIKYVSFIANRLKNFKKKDANLWNCSCPICLDSKSNKFKARGYIYMREQKLFYMCHNCNYCKPFGVFLQQIDQALYNEYRLEKFKDEHSTKVVRKPAKEEPSPDLFKTNTEERLRKKCSPKPTSLLDQLMDRLDTLPDDHEAVLYCRSRKIPEDQFHKIYFIPNIQNIVQLKEKYKDRIKSTEPRIVFPFFDTDGQLTGITMRGIRGEKLRYIVIKVKEDAPLVFGINDIDPKKRIYVTEGPIDSLFLPNAVAVGSTAMGKIGSVNLPRNDTVIIFDNQPRNKEVCDIIEKNIDAGNKVVIWNSKLTQKDINDMAKDGVDYMKEIESRIFSGLRAKLEFNKWKKC